MVGPDLVSIGVTARLDYLEVKLVLNLIAGLAFWLDGKPKPVALDTALDLAVGRHRLSFTLNTKERQEPLHVELRDGENSAAQVQFVQGK